MNSLRTMFPVLGILITLAGCSAESGTNGGVDSANAAQAKAEVSAESEASGGPREHHAGRPPMAGGPDFLLFASLHEDIGLSAEQKTTIEGLIAQNRPKAPPSTGAHDTARTTALAAAIRSGKVDGTLVQPPREGFEAAMKERLATSAKSLATLHDTLTSAQRTALVDAISAKAKSGLPQHGERAPGHMRGGHGAMRGMGMMGMLEDLYLTDAQREAIHSKLEASRPKPTDAETTAMKAKFETVKKEMDAKLQSFKADSFDANAFVTPPADMLKGPSADRPNPMANELSVVVSVLDQSQREQLAAKIEQGPKQLQRSVER